MCEMNLMFGYIQHESIQVIWYWKDKTTKGHFKGFISLPTSKTGRFIAHKYVCIFSQVWLMWIRADYEEATSNENCETGYSMDSQLAPNQISVNYYIPSLQYYQSEFLKSV